MKKVSFFMLIVALLLAACAPAATQPPAPVKTEAPAAPVAPVVTEAPAAPAVTEAPAAPPAGEKVTLRALFMKQAGYQEEDIVGITNEFKAANPNYEVQLDFVTYEALHDKIVTAAAAKSGAYDVVLVDCIWPAEFAAAGFILDVSDKISEDMKKDIWPGALEAISYQGKFYGMPWLNDVLYFYYNEEMLKAAGFDEAAKTWEEAYTQGMAAKEKGLVKYPFIEYFQQEEGLTIAYAYYMAAFGGKFFDEHNQPTFNSPEGLAALEYMVRGVKEGFYNPASFESTYEEVRRTFSQGEALFSVNWTYQFNLSNDPAESKIAGKSKITIMPGQVLTSATINGGMGLSVMADSKHPDEAWQYILFLSSPDVQKRYAKNALPIWISLFDDPALIAEQPVMIPVSREAYKFIVNRPLVPFYSEFSEIMARELQAALTSQKTAQQALDAAEAEVAKIAEQYK